MDQTEQSAQTALLTSSELANLVERLYSKVDEERYPAFLLLQQRSQIREDVYPFWDRFLELMRGESTYQRHIGLFLLAENVRWDHARLFDAAVEEYLSHCGDRKFVAARKAIQGVGIWLPVRPDLRDRVDRTFSQLDLLSYKESQFGLLLWDMVEVLMAAPPTDAGTALLLSAATGSLLGQKQKRQLCAHLGIQGKG